MYLRCVFSALSLPVRAAKAEAQSSRRPRALYGLPPHRAEPVRAAPVALTLKPKPARSRAQFARIRVTPRAAPQRGLQGSDGQPFALHLNCDRGKPINPCQSSHSFHTTEQSPRGRDTNAGLPRHNHQDKLELHVGVSPFGQRTPIVLRCRSFFLNQANGLVMAYPPQVTKKEHKVLEIIGRGHPQRSMYVRGSFGSGTTNALESSEAQIGAGLDSSEFLDCIAHLIAGNLIESARQPPGLFARLRGAEDKYFLWITPLGRRFLSENPVDTLPEVPALPPRDQLSASDIDDAVRNL